MKTTLVVFSTCAVLLLLCTTSCAHAWRVDCRKFVFAPKCRGVAAKRALANDQQDTDDFLLRRARLSFKHYDDDDLLNVSPRDVMTDSHVERYPGYTGGLGRLAKTWQQVTGTQLPKDITEEGLRQVVNQLLFMAGASQDSTQ